MAKVKHERLVKLALVLVGLLLAVQTARGALFALHPTRPEHAVLPFDTFQEHHSCFTAYFEASRLAREVPNVYESKLYLAPPDRAQRPSWQPPGDPRRTLDVFYVDAYEYPPPFLLLPRAFAFLTGDFLRARAVWFFFQAFIVIGTLALVAWHLGGSAGSRFARLAPLLYLALPVQICLQIGNFQVAALALGLVAMLAIARGHEVFGTGLLAFVTLAKLFPGALVLLFAFRRAWRPLLLTLAWCGIWIAFAVLVLGWAPFDSFVRYHLPRIESGEAFPQLRIPYAIAINQSIQAIPAKLALFGVGAGSERLGAVLAWVYTLVPCTVALLVRRSANVPLAWALVLAVGTYRSPFLPQEYATIGPLFVLCLLVAGAPMTRARWLLSGIACVLLQVQVPWGVSRDPLVGSLVNAVAQLAAVLVFGLAIAFLRRSSRLTETPSAEMVQAARLCHARHSSR